MVWYKCQKACRSTWSAHPARALSPVSSSRGSGHPSCPCCPGPLTLIRSRRHLPPARASTHTAFFWLAATSSSYHNSRRQAIHRLQATPTLPATYVMPSASWCYAQDGTLSGSTLGGGAPAHRSARRLREQVAIKGGGDHFLLAWACRNREKAGLTVDTQIRTRFHRSRREPMGSRCSGVTPFL
jgi:hypothetical protein